VTLLAFLDMASTQQSAASRQQCEVIPFNRPFVSGKEYPYMQEAIGNGHISGNGPFTKRCEELIGCERVLLMTSCTDALEMSALLLDVKPGDEVIVPSFTFVSTVNSFVLRGAVPRFIVRPDTLNLDESKLEELITPATKAIVGSITLASDVRWTRS
jgi:dTDP-4-amino-4,6-dideoxygalactose transaminase